MRSARFAPIALALGIICWVGMAGAALAAHPTPRALYTGKLGKGVGFQVSANGKTMAFKGSATVGMVCKPEQPPPSTVPAQFNLDPRSVPRVQIEKNGNFQGVSNGSSSTVAVIGYLTDHNKKLVFVLRTTGNGFNECATAKYTLHLAGRRVRRRK